MSNITTDFVTTTKKIVAEVRGVLTALHLIREDLKVIRDQIVSNTNQQTPNAQTDDSNAKQADGASLGTPAEINKRNGQKGKPEEKEDSGLRGFVKRWKRSARQPKFWVELAALTGLFVYTCETRRTNNLTKVALQTSKTQFTESQTLAREQFEKDQRPYIWVAKLDHEHVKAGEKIRWEYYLANYGKTPAIDVHIISKIKFGKDANEVPAFPMFTKEEGFIVPQGIPPPMSKGPLYHSAASDEVVADPASIDVDAGYFLFIHAEYYGLGEQTKYTTNICYFHLKTGATASCRGYSVMK